MIRVYALYEFNRVVLASLITLGLGAVALGIVCYSDIPTQNTHNKE